MKTVQEELKISFHHHEILLRPLGPASSEGDVIVVLPQEKVVFLGGLFYNQIHPMLRIHHGMDIQSWIQKLEALIEEFRSYTFVPAEGEIAHVSAVELFLDYLRSLTDPSVEFSECRKNFDWMEIPSQTSLEENFDLLRGIAKNFTTL